MNNVCYPMIANQATPSKFGPLWPPCKLRSDLRDELEEADRCLGAGGYEEAHECAKEIAEEAGLKYLGAGIHRAGFTFGSCVVKLALSSDGVDANKAEHEAWQKIGRNYTNIFAPVHDYASDYLWITQPRLVPISGFKNAYKYEDQFIQKTRSRGIDCGWDARPHNLGLKKGGRDAFLYDYGMGITCTVRTPSGTKKVEVRGAMI